MSTIKTNNVVDLDGNVLLAKGQAAKYVNSLQDLLAANKESHKVVNVLNYHTGLEGGGGVFYWDASKPKTEHNGGTVIDPAIAFPTDWNNQTQLTTWFTAGSSGTGCWVRQYDGAVNVKWFGAKGDTDNSGLSGSDDTRPVQSCLDFTVRYNKTMFVPSGDYTIKDSLIVSGIRSGSDGTFGKGLKIVGEKASTGITHDDGRYVAGTSFTFNENNSVLLKLLVDNYYIESFVLESISLRQAKGHINKNTSVAFQFIKTTGNYIRKHLFNDINCYGFGTFCEFSCPTGIATDTGNYYGPIKMDRVFTRDTLTGIDVNNAYLNLIDIHSSMFTQCTSSGGIYGRSNSGMLLSLHDTHFESCLPAAIQTGSYVTKISLHNVAAELCGGTGSNGQGFIKPFKPSAGNQSSLTIYVHSNLYPFVSMPTEFRLEQGNSIYSTCPVKVSGHGFYVGTPDTVTLVVSNDATYGQSDNYSFALVDNKNYSSTLSKLFKGNATGYASFVGKTPNKALLPDSIKGEALGLTDSSLTNNTGASETIAAAGTVYASFAFGSSAANNGFEQGSYTLNGVTKALKTGFSISKFEGVGVIALAVSAGDVLSNQVLRLYSSDYITVPLWQYSESPAKLSEAAKIYPAKYTTDFTVGINGSYRDQDFGDTATPYLLKLRYEITSASTGISYIEYIVKGSGSNGTRVYQTTDSSLNASITASPATNYHANLFCVDIGNTGTDIVKVSRTVEFLS